MSSSLRLLQKQTRNAITTILAAGGADSWLSIAYLSFDSRTWKALYRHGLIRRNGGLIQLTELGQEYAVTLSVNTQQIDVS